MCGEELLNDILIHIIPEFYFQGNIYRTDKKKYNEIFQYASFYCKFNIGYSIFVF